MKPMKPVNFLTDFEPHRLSEVVGYEPEVELIQNWFRSENFGRGILFIGAIGVGKSMLANLLATTAACIKRPQGSAEPCGGCTVCKFYINRSVQRYEGSKIDTDWLAGQLSWMSRPGGDELNFPEHGRWHPMLIDEFHELPKAAQRILRAELDYGWKDSFLIGTTSDIKTIDAALLDRMRKVILLPPSKKPLATWVVEIWQKAGHMVEQDKANVAAGLLCDNTNGRFRALLQVLQRLHDTGSKLVADDVRRACEGCGYGA